MDFLRTFIPCDIVDIIDEYASTIVLIDHDMTGFCSNAIMDINLTAHLDHIDSSCTKREKWVWDSGLYHPLNKKIFGSYLELIINGMKDCPGVYIDGYMINLIYTEMFYYVYDGGPLEIHPDIAEYYDKNRTKDVYVKRISNAKKIYLFNPRGTKLCSPEDRQLYGETLIVTDYDSDVFISTHDPSFEF